jgi:hypothetical protein
MPRESDHWLNKKNTDLGRPLRVLFVGNIANNAYLNAKFLREAGVDVDVISYDYYHIMSCPEWEELEINHDYKDDYFPVFDKRDTECYLRPAWFIQGALPLCYGYIKARSEKRWFMQNVYKKLMEYSRRSAGNQDTGTRLGLALSDRKYYFILFSNQLLLRSICLVRNLCQFAISSAISILSKLIPKNGKITRLVKKSIILKRAYISKILNKSAKAKRENEFKNHLDELISKFSSFFPERKDKLTYEDTRPYHSVLKLWNEIFSHYDLVQCYGADPIVALLGKAKRYVAYEHGTLRAYTMEDKLAHRLTALAYRSADHVFITNGDCLEYANKLGITQFTPMIHPVPEYGITSAKDKQDTITKIKKQLNAELLLFCPHRHDWVIKGIDLHIRAFKEISRRTKGRAVLLLVDWGLEVNRSKELIKQLGFETHVRWIKPLSRKNVMNYMIASDVILDQMALPCFGATAPQAIALEVPVIMSYSPESTSWIISEDAPIIPAFKAEDVVKGVMQALDPQWLEEYRYRARTWFKSQHHADRIVSEHLQVYERLLETA